MSLATRLVILLVIPFVFCVTAFAISTVRLRRALMFSEADRELRDAGSTLQLTFHAVSREQGEDRYTKLAEDLTQAADRIQGVLFFDASGALLGASKTTAGRRDVLAPFAARIHESGRAEMASYQLGGELTYAFAVPIGGSAPSKQVHAVAIILRNLAYVEKNLAHFTGEVAGVAAVVTLALAFSVWLLLRRMVARPLSTLLGGVESVAAGDLAVVMPIRRGDEIGRLASAFNHMTASLRSAAAELETKGQANLALERRLQHAQRLTLIGQLTASIAHQIGSPLNVILGRARYALKSGGQNERDRRHFRDDAPGGGALFSVMLPWRGRPPSEYSLEAT
jgi:HAMP domain-containing protein